MALFRQIHVSFWDDPWVEDLEPLEKYLYLYLMTNARTTQCGIYEVTKRKMADETGLDKAVIDTFMKRFERDNKVIYDEDNHEIIMLNWIKHNAPKSPKIVICVIKEMLAIKNRHFISIYISLCEKFGHSLSNDKYDIDTLFCQPQKLKEVPKTPEEVTTTRIPYKEIVELYHQYCVSLPRLQVLSDKRKDQIKSIWKKFDAMIKKQDKQQEIPEIFKRVFQKVEASDFLSGRDGKWRNCSFDWIITLNNFIKIYENQYENKNPDKTRGW